MQPRDGRLYEPQHCEDGLQQAPTLADFAVFDSCYVSAGRIVMVEIGGLAIHIRESPIHGDAADETHFGG